MCLFPDLLPNYQDYVTARNSDKCIAAKRCDDGKLARSYEKCNQTFDVTCGNEYFYAQNLKFCEIYIYYFFYNLYIMH